MKKIISNYIIDDDQNEQAKEKPISKVPPIIKIPVYQDEKVTIKSDSDQSNKISEPIIHLNRNNEGIVLSIEVHCSCGEKILIKLDY